MKVLFLGDSITEGIPGVSYVDILQSKIQGECINRGVGGDTVSSLFRRVKKMNDLEEFDFIVLFIGVNDVFGKLTTVYKIVKRLRRQTWAKNKDAFQNKYEKLLEYILKQNERIIVVPPLLIGEDCSNQYNKELSHLVEIVEDLTMKHNVIYEDVYSVFKEYLIDKKVSSYIPDKLLVVYKDTLRKKRSEVDEISKKRGLHLTMDGVHMNSYGAMLISKCIIRYLSNIFQKTPSSSTR